MLFCTGKENGIRNKFVLYLQSLPLNAMVKNNHLIQMYFNFLF